MSHDGSVTHLHMKNEGPMPMAYVTRISNQDFLQCCKRASEFKTLCIKMGLWYKNNGSSKIFVAGLIFAQNLFFHFKSMRL